MPRFTTPLYVKENPDSLAAQLWHEADQASNKAIDTLILSAPKNNPGQYIDLHEIADRIGVKYESMKGNHHRKQWFPFEPVMQTTGAGGGLHGKFYDRHNVLVWINDYNRKKKARESHANHAGG